MLPSHIGIFNALGSTVLDGVVLCNGTADALDFQQIISTVKT